LPELAWAYHVPAKTTTIAIMACASASLAHRIAADSSVLSMGLATLEFHLAVYKAILVEAATAAAAPTAPAMRIIAHIVPVIKRKLLEAAIAIHVVLQHHIAARRGITAVLQQEPADAAHVRPAEPATRVQRL
jgi:hypothetical protein